MSIGDSDRLAYAWVNSSDRGSGVVRFMGFFPKVALLQISAIMAVQ
jgi:hypothetical protein